MKTIFPKPVLKLPEADVPIDGIRTYLSQAENHQIIFMEFEKDAVIPQHAHESQWEVVLEGRVDLTVDGVTTSYYKGDRFFIPKDVIHAAKVYAGYASVVLFNQRNRYRKKQK